MPAVTVDVNSFQIPCNLKLADPAFHVPGAIDLIIGSEIFWKLLCIGQIQMGKAKPTFQKTKLGWIVSDSVSPAITTSKATYCNLAYQTTLQEQLEKFWLLEEFQKKYNLTVEEQKCEDHFNETYTREKDGRFIVHLPLKDNYKELGDSYDIAKRRLNAMERKLSKHPELKRQYDAFMREYVELGHMKLIQNASSDEQEYPTYYLLHHAVLKEESETTRLRVVFDASAKTESGISLNDVQMVGPTIQQDLFNILMRFREIDTPSLLIYQRCIAKFK